MIIEIDPNAGFCFGVVNAIKTAEENLTKGTEINCLGEIVHNEMENDRLKELGMKTVKHDQFPDLAGKNVLIRAHGEPPSTYELAKKYNINLIDATCPVVLKPSGSCSQGVGTTAASWWHGSYLWEKGTCRGYWPLWPNQQSGCGSSGIN